MLNLLNSLQKFAFFILFSYIKVRSYERGIERNQVIHFNSFIMITLEQLRADFEVFNNKYFNGELPAIQIKLNHTKRALGQFCWDNTGWFPKIWITISTYYDRPIRDVQNTLLHEMIHYWQYEKSYQLGHGRTFKQKAREINQDGWFISRCNEVNGEISEYVSTSGKTYNVFAFHYRPHDKYYAFVASPKCVDRYRKWVSGEKDFDGAIYFVSTDYKTFDKYRLCRTKYGCKSISAEDYNAYFNSANVEVLIERTKSA